MSETTRELAWEIAKYAIPAIIIGSALGFGVWYLGKKIDKKADQLKKKKKKKQK